MSKSGVSSRTQVRALLLRTVHRQKRDHCNNFCVFIFPSLLVIFLAVIPAIIRGRVDEIKPYQQNPRGAFALRPFPPMACRFTERVRSRSEAKELRENCDMFSPGWTVPVLAKPAHWAILGSRNATGESSGVLQHLSIHPFVYPPALPGSGYPFADTQSKYDGVFLHDVLENNTLRFRALASQIQDSQFLDRKFETATRRLDDVGNGRSPMLDLLFGDWFKGNALGKHFGAFTFQRVSKQGNRTDIAATVFYNASARPYVTESSQLGAGLVALESAIFSSATDGRSKARAFIRKMPIIAKTGPLGFINLAIAAFIGFSFHFLLPTFLQFLVMERQNRIRGLMAMMGLNKVTYWVGSYLGFYLLYLVAGILIVVIGFLTKIGFFKLNTPVSYLILFFIWGHNLVAFATFLAPFFSSADTALVVGWLYVLLVNIIGGPFIGRRLAAETAETSWAGIMLLPSFAFLRSIFYVGTLNSGGKGVVLNSEVHLGIQLGMCRGRGSFCRSYLFLFGEWIVFMILGLYFDRVLPGAVGGRQHPLFFLGYKRGASIQGSDAEGIGAGNNVVEGEEDDIAAEHAKAAMLAKEMVFNPVDGVVISELRKTFFTGTRVVQAVRGISFVAQKGEIMGILGHNGAGKTTMFKMLVGEIEPTSGEAHVFGHSISTDMARVHENMGVTPQENVLWHDMTIEEHLFFYGRVKGLSGADLKASVEESLAAVDLTFARKRLSSKCSGGMKRRLAVAISMTGNPAFIALDEPSTGLDILTREKLWVSIQNAKHDKTVLLTTHSLDEAETLCDRVAIMSRGRLMCIGKPEELKLRLGMGHHLNISLPDTKVEELHNAMLSLSPQAQIDTKMAGSVEYALPKSVPLSEIVSLIEQRRNDLQIYDWAISQSTLEDVFMSVTKRAAELYEEENQGMATTPQAV